jgi:hypothetical protein
MWESTWFEDDGLSANPSISSFTISYGSTAATVRVKFEKHIPENGGFVPLWKHLAIVLPVFDERVVAGESGKTVLDQGRDRHGRRVFQIEAV